MLKVSAFYLEKQKSFIPKNIYLSRCPYQNKKALFTDPIFSEGFGLMILTVHTLKFQILFQICSWVQENGGWSAVLYSGLNVMQQTAVIGTCAALFLCCVIYIRKNW